MAGGKRVLPILALTGAVALGLAACGPEGARTRGGDAGADVGNRPGEQEDVQLFNADDREARIYFDTPDDLPAAAEGEPIMEPTAIPPQAAATAEGAASPMASPESLPATPGATPVGPIATPAAATPVGAEDAGEATPATTGGDGSLGSALPGTPTAVASPGASPVAASPAAGAAPTAAPAPSPPATTTP